MLLEMPSSRHALRGVQPYLLAVFLLAAGVGPLVGCSDETRPGGGRSEADHSEQTAGDDLTQAKLLELYPTHDDYVRKYTEAADKALANGYLLQADYDESVMQAKAAPIPK